MRVRLISKDGVINTDTPGNELPDLIVFRKKHFIYRYETIYHEARTTLELKE